MSNHAIIRQFFIDELLDGDDEDFENTTNLLDLGLIDSMTVLKLKVFIEDQFNIKIPQQAFKPHSIASVENIVALISSHRPV